MGMVGTAMSQTGKYSGKPTGGDPYGGKFWNGRIPTAQLRPFSDAHLLLSPDAAACADVMIAAAARDGVELVPLVGYRDYAGQQRMKREWTAKGKPNYAAKPGTSNHGLGTAVDWNVHLAGALDWLRANATKYGWDQPEWADDGVGTEEDWHWQFIIGFRPEDCPNVRNSIAVTVNGIAVPDAAGYEAGGASYAWVRPVAGALHASINPPRGNTIAVTRGSETRQLDCVVEGGQCFVPLREWTKFPGITLQWTPGAVEIST